MSALLRIVWINDILVPILAILFNLLLLWLIKTVKTKTLIHINYSLVPNSILDISASIFTFIVAPHIFHQDGRIYIVYGDLFGFIDSIVACHIGALFSAFLYTSMISITISFYIRYLVICKNRILSIPTMIRPYFLLFIVFLIVYLLFLWFYFSALEFNKNVPGTLLKAFWKEEFSKPPLYFANEVLSIPFLSCIGFISLMFTFAYSLIFYYSKQISATLKTHVHNNNSATKLLHKQIQRTLLIQTIGPSLIGSIPLLLILAKGFFKLRSSDISLVLSLFFPWISFCNPIAAVIFIKPYRRYLLTIFNFRRHGKISKVLPVQNIS